MCTVFTASFAVPIYDSTMCILMIAIDRYILILYPFHKRMSNQMAVGLVILIAFLAIGPAIPMLIYTKLVELNVPLLGIDKVLCIEKWPSDTISKVFTMSLFLLRARLDLRPPEGRALPRLDIVVRDALPHDDGRLGH